MAYAHTYIHAHACTHIHTHVRPAKLPSHAVWNCKRRKLGGTWEQGYVHACNAHDAHTAPVKEVYVKENDSIGEDEVILHGVLPRSRNKTDHTPSRRLSNQLEYQYFCFHIHILCIMYYFLLVNLHQKDIVM